MIENRTSALRASVAEARRPRFLLAPFYTGGAINAGATTAHTLSVKSAFDYR